MSAPRVPKASSVSDQQLQYGIKAGTAQNELNQTNQVTPTGSLTYTQTGKNADGTPQWTATSALNAQQQALLNAQTSAATGAAGAAGDIIKQNAGKWASGPDMNETGITKAIMGWGHDYMDPIFQQQNAAEDAKLANQGIAPGSEAYTNAKMARSRNTNDVYTKLLMEGQGQALQAAEAKYMDPLRALSTLSSGQQPGIQYAQTPQANVSAPDYTTAANNQYTAQKSNYDSMMSGLFKIPTTLLGGWASGGFK
jgi:hypothetical protein